MGMCLSSEKHVAEGETTYDEGPIKYAVPHAGQTEQPVKKTKSKFSQYPGNKRPPHNPYVPNESEFTNGQVTKHFVNYGGGNALTLVDGPPPDANQSAPGSANKQYIQVTLPPGTYPGEKLHVKSPDGQVVEIQVPEGMSEGEIFTVEFAAGPPPPLTMKQEQIQQYNPYNTQQQYQPVASTAPTSSKYDDDIPVAVPL